MDKNKLKSNKGISGVEIVISIGVILLFLGLIGGLFYKINYTSTSIRLNALAIDYAVKIAEKTDRLTYEEVNNDLNNNLKEEFEILDSYNAKISVEKYSDIDNTKEDIIKIVTIEINYDFMNQQEEFVIRKLKIKE